MSYTMNVLVRTKEEDGEKLYKAVGDYRVEAVEETGEDDYPPVEILSLTPTQYVLSGDPYELGGFMIRLFTQKVWQGGCIGPQSPDIFVRCSNLPVWDGTYDPERSSEETLSKEFEEYVDEMNRE